MSDTESRLVVAAYPADTLTVYRAYSPLSLELAVRIGANPGHPAPAPVSGGAR